MDELVAGYGRIRITPPLGVELSGYGYYLQRQAVGVRNHIFARALYLDGSGGRQLIIVSDLIGLQPEISSEVRRLIANELKIPFSRIMMPCTHVHTGPATHHLEGCGEMDADYLITLPSLYLEAARRAVADATVVRGYAVCDLPIEPFSWNRAIPGGELDVQVRGIRLDRGIRLNRGIRLERGARAQARPLALLSYGCHPVTYKVFNLISPDFPGAAVDALEARGIDAIFVNGPCGDVNPLLDPPYDRDVDGREALIRRNGKTLADAFVDGTKKTRRGAPEVQSCRWRLGLRLRPMTVADLDGTVLRIADVYGKEAPINTVTRLWRDQWAARLQLADQNGWKSVTGSNLPYVQTVEVQMLRIGPVLLIGVPFEIFQRYRSLIADAFPDLTVIVGGNTNTTVCYLASREKQLLHGYEPEESNYLYDALPPADGALEELAAATVSRLCRALDRPTARRGRHLSSLRSR